MGALSLGCGRSHWSRRWIDLGFPECRDVGSILQGLAVMEFVAIGGRRSGAWGGGVLLGSVFRGV